jgi:hypothetical protein
MKNNISFTKQNYYIILAGLAIVVLGFMLMSGGGSENANEFNAEELFSFRRITLAPIMVIAGYVVVVIGIMKKTNTTIVSGEGENKIDLGNN